MYALCTGYPYPAVFEAFILAEETVSTLATFAAAGFDMKGKDGEWTLLHKAVNERHHEARDFLFDLGADPSFKDDQGGDVAAIEERSHKIDAVSKCSQKAHKEDKPKRCVSFSNP